MREPSRRKSRSSWNAASLAELEAGELGEGHGEGQRTAEMRRRAARPGVSRAEASEKCCCRVSCAREPQDCRREGAGGQGNGHGDFAFAMARVQTCNSNAAF
jgi:hypothetical protein